MLCNFNFVYGVSIIEGGNQGTGKSTNLIFKMVGLCGNATSGKSQKSSREV